MDTTGAGAGGAGYYQPMTHGHSPIRVAINGYGNLGKAVEQAVQAAEDMELVAVFTRRDPATIKPQFCEAVAVSDAPQWRDKVDVCVLCGGSATDLADQGPDFAALFNTVDSFDTHAKIPEYFAAVDAAADAEGHLSVISTGWDPGLFSLARIIAQSALPDGKTYTFWGRGVSQGHSDAIRRIEGVETAIQYTVPVEENSKRIRAGEELELTTREQHTRECFVVAADGADRERIEREIVTMPNYFADYDTTVHFISREEFDRDHTGMPHGGEVIRSGHTSGGARQVVSFGLTLESNPQFTGAFATATARAVARLAREGRTGAMTVFDIAPAYYSPLSAEELRSQLL